MKIGRLLGLWPLLLMLGWWSPKAFGQVAPPPNTVGITPDVTLENSENSRIQTPTTNNSIVIEGGASRGAALFHSFEQFNIGENQQVFFTNPADISAIISRVTGDTASTINGTLGVLGSADLFLLNPNGIRFGPDAQLNLSGSFTASTADSFQLGNVTFSATEPTAVPLLTINVPPGIQFGANSPERSIHNQANLTLPQQQQLTLDGGTIEQAGTIAIPGGEVKLRGQDLNLTGDINTRTATGQVGQLRLISPTDVTIQAMAQPNNSLTNTAIAQALQNNALTVQADGDLTVVDAISSASGTPLTLSSRETLTLIGDSSGPSQLTGNVTLQSDRDIRLDTYLLFVTSLQNDPQLTLQAGEDVVIVGRDPLSEDGRGRLTLTGNGGTLSIEANKFNAVGSTIITSVNGGEQGPDIAVDVNQDLIFQGSNLVTNTNNGQTAGDIQIQAGQSVQLLPGSSIFSLPSDMDGLDNTGNTGNIDIQATDTILLENSVVLSQAEGNAGDVNFSTQKIILDGTNGASLLGSDTRPFSTGDAGDITLKANESIDLIGNQPGPFILLTQQPPTLEGIIAQSFGNTTIQASSFGVGSSGNITVNTDNLTLRNGAFLANTVGFGSPESTSGDININADDIQLSGLAAIATGSLGNQDSGALNIRSNRITLNDGAGIGVSSVLGNGDAGELHIETQDLTVSGGSAIAANTAGDGSGGLLNIQAQSITVEGTLADGTVPSTLLTDVFPTSTGAGGELRLQADTLQVLNGGQIRASTQGPQDAGNLDITAGQVTVSGTSTRGVPSTLESQSTSPGRAGTLSLVADRLTISDRAQINTQSQQGSGGNIRLRIGDVLILRRQGQISATADTLVSGGNGGNIEIGTRFIVAPTLENSDITANALEGSGGNVTIQANALLGIAFRDFLTPLSDITASSQFGLAGSVTIDEYGFSNDLAPEATRLSAALADPTDRLIVGCLLDEDAHFVVTGRGGIPANPSEILNQGLIWQDPRGSGEGSTPDNSTQENSVNEAPPESDNISRPSSTPAELTEAQGWQINEQGNVELFSTSNTPPQPANKRCPQ
ncbi:MAG: filamentous hemagglutinin N-terminal domain-containing protein [Cyanobacteria bacterium P01_F01_bin.53]